MPIDDELENSKSIQAIAELAQKSAQEILVALSGDTRKRVNECNGDFSPTMVLEIPNSLALVDLSFVGPGLAVGANPGC